MIQDHIQIPAGVNSIALANKSIIAANGLLNEIELDIAYSKQLIRARNSHQDDMSRLLQLLTDENESMKNKLESHEQEILELRQEQESSDSRFQAELSEVRETYESELDRTLQRIDELSKENKQYSSLVDNLKQELDLLKLDKVQQAQAQANRRDAEVEAVEQVKILTEKLNETMRYCQTLENAHHELSQHRGNTSAMDKWNQEQALQELNNEIRDLKAKLQLVELENTNLKSIEAMREHRVASQGQGSHRSPVIYEQVYNPPTNLRQPDRNFLLQPTENENWNASNRENYFQAEPSIPLSQRANYEIVQTSSLRRADTDGWAQENTNFQAVQASSHYLDPNATRRQSAQPTQSSHGLNVPEVVTIGPTTLYTGPVPRSTSLSQSSHHSYRKPSLRDPDEIDEPYPLELSDSYEFSIPNQSNRIGNRGSQSNRIASKVSSIELGGDEEFSLLKLASMSPYLGQSDL